MKLTEQIRLVFLGLQALPQVLREVQEIRTSLEQIQTRLWTAMGKLEELQSRLSNIRFPF